MQQYTSHSPITQGLLTDDVVVKLHDDVMKFQDLFLDSCNYTHFTSHRFSCIISCDAFQFIAIQADIFYWFTHLQQYVFCIYSDFKLYSARNSSIIMKLESILLVNISSWAVPIMLFLSSNAKRWKNIKIFLSWQSVTRVALLLILQHVWWLKMPTNTSCINKSILTRQSIWFLFKCPLFCCLASLPF